MNSDKSDPLDELLREWTVDAPLSPGSFRGEVWQRIAAEESAAETRRLGGPAGLARAAWRLLAGRGHGLHPAWGVAVFVIAVTMGAGMGHRSAENAREAAWTQLGQSYADSINPMALAARHGASANVGGSINSRSNAGVPNGR